MASTLDRAVWVRALAEDIVLCSWVRHFTLTVPLSTQVYKWVPANLMLGVILRWTSIQSRGWGVEILLVASCYRIGTGNKHRLDGPLGSCADLTYIWLSDMTLNYYDLSWKLTRTINFQKWKTLFARSKNEKDGQWITAWHKTGSFFSVSIYFS